MAVRLCTNRKGRGRKNCKVACLSVDGVPPDIHRAPLQTQGDLLVLGFKESVQSSADYKVIQVENSVVTQDKDIDFKELI